MAKVKKKNTHTNKITPTVDIDGGILFEKLSSGECFLRNGGLWIKETGDDQYAVNLATGKTNESLCGETVTPVIVTITWKRK